MGVKTGLSRVATVVRLIGIVALLFWVIVALLDGKTIGFGLLLVGMGVVCLGACWLIAFVIDGFSE